MLLPPRGLRGGTNRPVPTCVTGTNFWGRHILGESMAWNHLASPQNLGTHLTADLTNGASSWRLGREAGVWCPRGGRWVMRAGGAIKKTDLVRDGTGSVSQGMDCCGR